MSTATIAKAWYQGLAQLTAQGIEVPEPDSQALKSAWTDFENLAYVAESVDSFEQEAPKLAARLAGEAIARAQRNLDPFEVNPS